MNATTIAPVPDLTSTPTSPEHAQTMFRELAQARIDNRVTDAMFFPRADYLGRIAAGEQNVPLPGPHTVVIEAPDGSKSTVSAEAAAFDDKAPPRSGAGYEFEYSRHGVSLEYDEARAFDTELRNTLHENGVPQRFAGYWYDTVERLAKRFEGASQTDIKAHVASVRAELESRWGADFRAKIDAIDEFVTGLPGPVGDLLIDAPWLLADPLVMLQLDDFVQYCNGKRA